MWYAQMRAYVRERKVTECCCPPDWADKGVSHTPGDYVSYAEAHSKTSRMHACMADSHDKTNIYS